LATFRVTRLITTDDLPPIQAARDWLIERVGKNSTLAEGLRCGWCVSAHIAWMLVCLATRKPPWRLTFGDWMLVAALSATTGLLGTADSALGRIGQ
jgi:hypothetical protein